MKNIFLFYAFVLLIMVIELKPKTETPSGFRLVERPISDFLAANCSQRKYELITYPQGA